MERSEAEKRLTAIKHLADVFGKELSPEVFQIYFEATEDLWMVRFEKAYKSCIADCEFFPVPAVFRQKAGPPSAAEAKAIHEKQWGEQQ